MATQTPNLGLTLPIGTENVSRQVINTNNTKIDTAFGAIPHIESGFGILADGDTHDAITAGECVYVKNNTHNLGEGVYIATADIAQDASVSSTNLSPVPNGIGSMVTKVANTNVSISASDVATFETAMDAVLASMNDKEVRAIKFVSSMSSNGFKNGTTYVGYVTRISSGVGCCSLVNHSAHNMFIGISGGTYTYNSITTNAVYNNNADQWVNGGTNSTKLGVAHNETNKNAYMNSDANGGNFVGRKGDAWFQIDTAGMADDGTGFARLTTNNTGGTQKVFQFKQGGDFINGNGVSMDTINTKLGKIGFARNTTSTTDGKCSFTMPVNSSGVLLIGSQAPVNIGMASSGVYYSTMPTGYSISSSGTTVTVTKTSSVSTSVSVTCIYISA